MSTPIKTEAPKPVEVSGEALRALTTHLKKWSGWSDARLICAKPVGSPFARTDTDTRVFTINTDTLVLNPNRVLLTVTPFRLRQEAVLTGTMLHEAGHARHSRWMSSTNPAMHSDGTVPTKQTIAVARLMEEPRIEGLIASEAERIGATDLDWTMRAAAAALIPTTRANIEDPGQQVMDVLDSWAKRAGRQIALAAWTDHRLPSWVHDFNAVLHEVLVAWLSANGDDDATTHAKAVREIAKDMIMCTDDTGPTMVDKARGMLAILFPETDGDGEGAPMPSACGAGQSEQSESESESGEDGEGDESGEGGEGDTEPEDEGSGTEDGEGDSGEDGDEDGESDADEDADEDAESDADEDGDGDADTEPEGDDSDDLSKALAEAMAALAGVEQEADSQTEAEAETESQQAPPPLSDDDEDSAGGVGHGTAGGDAGGWRQPTKDERDVQKGAERFLRDLIDPTETAKVTLSESPSATVDGAAMAAWKAGGQQRDPMFFKRTRREVQPSSPVKVAILVDISGSMDALQAPSALLSWALASAALDLRNFAGRGQQVESTLIHWGDSARIVQRTGQVLPGIKEVPCWEGTSAMHRAMELVEAQMPGFFDLGERPEHRLLVQFTDWDLGWSATQAQPWVKRALEAGVNMISVVPDSYSKHWSSLDSILSGCRVQRGTSTLMKYNPRNPGGVWEEAAKALQ